MASNRNVLKKYAPQARLDFIQAITNRAAQFGITKGGNASGEVQGDLFILKGKAFPRSVASQRGRLIARIARDGFAQVMEAVAYTWFNRFLAIRYMELHHYFDHGCRVLSHTARHDEPEILEKATTIDLPGLDRDEIVGLKLDGTKDEQIYRKLLIAQCNDLHRAMPFLFERIDDETELLLPENLLQSDSIIRKLVNEIDETEWQEIEIIGWLYQFYISEKKDQVIGKVVKSEDIPAATQLFTPNWIVKYMVENSLGAQWLATYPDSAIRAGMEYYIAPAEQTPEVQAQIDAITPKHLDPEAITLIDPAVGSGHILVEAYDLFRAIYLERGYTRREAARAILTKNLFGLDIDDRAAQMAGFALLMKACADDRSVLRNPPVLNVLSLQDSAGLDADAFANVLLPQERFEMVPSGDLLPETLAQPTLAAQQPASSERRAIKALVKLFDGAKTFGSLITVPEAVTQSLPLLDGLLAKPLTGDLLHRQAQEDAQEELRPLVAQARLLGGQYDCVVANPPYMGGKGMNPSLKKFAQERYPDSKSDLFAMFIERGFDLVPKNGRHAMVTMQSWMFLSSYEKLRLRLLCERTLEAMSHMGNGVMGIAFGTAATVFRKCHLNDARGSFCWVEQENIENDRPISWPPNNKRNAKASIYPAFGGFFRASASDFEKIPGSPIGYWASQATIGAFASLENLFDFARPRQGLATTNDDRFLRLWFEVPSSKMILPQNIDNSTRETGKWFAFNKGGEYRKWYGNNEFVINFEGNGATICDYIDNTPNVTVKSNGRIINRERYFFEGVTWSSISSGRFSMRFTPVGFVFGHKGPMCFGDLHNDNLMVLGLGCSPVFDHFLRILCPTLDYSQGPLSKLPLPAGVSDQAACRIEECVRISRSDWDAYETSWDFAEHPLLAADHRQHTLAASYTALGDHWQEEALEIQRLEEENNHLFIDAYGLQGELTPEVPLSEITLTCNLHYRYGGDLTDAEREARLKSDTMRELISYAMGCMMGRYSLAEPGLIYAHAGGVSFDPPRYGAFSADEDGIIPLTEEQWFADDAATRIEEFLGVAWPKAPITETLATLMEGKGVDPRAALRAYLSKQFYKDHLQTYKNRPIYWLFSSGKQKGFEALVYLHRYNEGTLARMRTVYVTPLLGKLPQRISDLDADIAGSTSSAEKANKTRAKEKLAKQLVELRSFDEELRHLADQRIGLDLDDGVKVNYGRFGNLLAARDNVCGKDKGGDE